jgi:hypothetical protein
MQRVVEIGTAQAERLHRLAEARGIGEDALISEALELLFHHRERQESIADDLRVWQEMESEPYDVPPYTTTPNRNPNDYVVTHAAVVPELLDELGRVVGHYYPDRRAEPSKSTNFAFYCGCLVAGLIAG